MKTLLYITASPSKQAQSISKKLGRYLVDNYIKKHPEYEVQELDLYTSHIPEVWPIYLGDELKLYIDCICLGGKVINFKDEKKRPEPLLNDKERLMIYLQTSGGDFPFFLESKMNHGASYCKDLFKGLGVAHFEKVLVEGVVQICSHTYSAGIASMLFFLPLL